MSPPISLGVPDPACHDGANCEGVQEATTPRALESPRKQYSISSALLKSNAKHRLFRAKALIESGVRTSDSYRESRSITNLINSTTNISRTAQADYDDSVRTQVHGVFSVYYATLATISCHVSLLAIGAHLPVSNNL